MNSLLALTVAAACLLAANANPTNDVTLFVRALYQDCADENQDHLAVQVRPRRHSSPPCRLIRRPSSRRRRCCFGYCRPCHCRCHCPCRSS